MYIVIFNLGSRDPEFLTNGHGFIEEFSEREDAIIEAKAWIDGTQYRNYKNRT
jgi:hypothetical protein